MSVPLLGEEFGKVGLRRAAKFSYGWLSTSNVGQQTA
jgi:hypothetical protein